jgi:hypothetical protein
MFSENRKLQLSLQAVRNSRPSPTTGYSRIETRFANGGGTCNVRDLLIKKEHHLKYGMINLLIRVALPYRKRELRSAQKQKGQKPSHPDLAS